MAGHEVTRVCAEKHASRVRVQRASRICSRAPPDQYLRLGQRWWCCEQTQAGDAGASREPEVHRLGSRESYAEAT